MNKGFRMVRIMGENRVKNLVTMSLYNQSFARDNFLASRQRQRNNVIEPQGQEKIRKIFGSWCLDEVVTTNIVILHCRGSIVACPALFIMKQKIANEHKAHIRAKASCSPCLDRRDATERTEPARQDAMDSDLRHARIYHTV